MDQNMDKKTILGAIIGDIVGSVYEWHNIKTKVFPFFSENGFPTDDSIMTIALCDAILQWDKEGRKNIDRLSELSVEKMRLYGRRYPAAGYGGHFAAWLLDDSMGPYNSCGNGSAMRVSPVGYAAENREECIQMAKAVTAVTHDHPDGILGAEATALQIYQLLKEGKTLGEMKEMEVERYYPIDFTLSIVRPGYQWGSLCSDTCPVAFQSVYEATDYEDAIRNAISLGGDSDTIAAISGGIAAAAFGVPEELYEKGLSYLDEDLRRVVLEFDRRFL
ncbi:MAG: ADP-ribosylglycohydrolase family protein [Spirochaetales bacterium]|nr:ADP-ribosylglycohydrolase family protein [Candidatus Physcosoma equi]